MKILTAEEARNLVKTRKQAIIDDMNGHLFLLGEVFDEAVRSVANDGHVHFILSELIVCLHKKYQPSTRWDYKLIENQFKDLAIANGYEIYEHHYHTYVRWVTP
jgi:hypothetical protein